MTEEVATLARLDHARAELARCTDMKDLKRIRDHAAALQAFVKAQHLAADLAAKAGSIRIDAERRIGELERERVPDAGINGAGPGRGKKNAVAQTTTFSKDERKRFRALARVPEAKLEALKAKLGADVTPTGVLKAERSERKKPRAEEDEERAPRFSDWDLSKLSPWEDDVAVAHYRSLLSHIFRTWWRGDKTQLVEATERALKWMKQSLTAPTTMAVDGPQAQASLRRSPRRA